MPTGLFAGILWGLDTVILGFALEKSGFCSTNQAIMLAPFVSTFFHDLFSSLLMIILTTVKKQWRNILNVLKTKGGRFIIIGALLGGPIGMSGYVCAINYIGPAYTAIITAVYPAAGALLAKIFLKEKMKPYQFVALGASILGIIALGYSPSGTSDIKNLYVGFGCALLAVLGWSLEAVICSYSMKNSEITNEHILQMRQLISAISYGAVLLPILKGWRFTADIFISQETGIILASALFGTASYLLYYKAIHKIGASKAMALNITYSAWAMIFSVLLLHSAFDLKSVICCVIIVVSSIIAGSTPNKQKISKK